MKEAPANRWQAGKHQLDSGNNNDDSVSVDRCGVGSQLASSEAFKVLLVKSHDYAVEGPSLGVGVVLSFGRRAVMCDECLSFLALLWGWA